MQLYDYCLLFDTLYDTVSFISKSNSAESTSTAGMIIIKLKKKYLRNL